MQKYQSQIEWLDNLIDETCRDLCDLHGYELEDNQGDRYED